MTAGDDAAAAALGNRLSADLYGARILAEGVEDEAGEHDALRVAGARPARRIDARRAVEDLDRLLGRGRHRPRLAGPLPVGARAARRQPDDDRLAPAPSRARALHVLRRPAGQGRGAGRGRGARRAGRRTPRRCASWAPIRRPESATRRRRSLPTVTARRPASSVEQLGADQLTPPAPTARRRPAESSSPARTAATSRARSDWVAMICAATPLSCERRRTTAPSRAASGASSGDGGGAPRGSCGASRSAPRSSAASSSRPRRWRVASGIPRTSPSPSTLRGGPAGHLDQHVVGQHGAGAAVQPAGDVVAPLRELASDAARARAQARHPGQPREDLVDVALVGDRLQGAALLQRPVQASGLAQALLQRLAQLEQVEGVLGGVAQLLLGQRAALPAGEGLGAGDLHAQDAMDEGLVALLRARSPGTPRRPGCRAGW